MECDGAVDGVVTDRAMVTDRFERQMQRRYEELPLGVSLSWVRGVAAWLARRAPGPRPGPRFDPAPRPQGPRCLPAPASPAPQEARAKLSHPPGRRRGTRPAG